MDFLSRIAEYFTGTAVAANTNKVLEGSALVRQLEIKSQKLTNHLFKGEYHSAFKGTGMTFKEVKEYSNGDDVRFIDWNVSARMGSTYSKVFEEERELSLFLLVDVSASHQFGTAAQSKKEMVAEMASVLAFSAINNNDKVSLLFCTDIVEKFIPPKKGREHVLYMIKELIGFVPKGKKTDLAKAFQFINNTSRHKSIVFILSDFADDGYEQALKVAARRHDVVGIQVYDKGEIALPSIGLIQMVDAETGITVWMNTNDGENKSAWKSQHEKTQTNTKEIFKKAGADLLQIATDEDYVKALQQFFIKRA